MIYVDIRLVGCLFPSVSVLRAAVEHYPASCRQRELACVHLIRLGNSHVGPGVRQELWGFGGLSSVPRSVRSRILPRLCVSGHLLVGDSFVSNVLV